MVYGLCFAAEATAHRPEREPDRPSGTARRRAAAGAARARGMARRVRE